MAQTAAQTRPKKIRIGDLLVEHGIISQRQLSAALERQRNSGKKLGRQLVEDGVMSEDQLLNFLARQLKIDYIDLRNYELNPEVVQLIPEVQARRFRVIALAETRHGLLLGMADPTDLFAYDEVVRIIDRPLHIAVVNEGALLHAFDTIYRKTGEISGFAQELGQQLTGDEAEFNHTTGAAEATDAPVVKLLRTLMEDAVQVQASDIHIEPDENDLRIRFRIDGMLHTQAVMEKRIASALMSRLKLMAGLDISEKRLPQDGRFEIELRHKNIDVRLSTLPLQHGESAVMRLLDNSGGIMPLDRLGMDKQILEPFRALAHNPHGIVLVVGPTGSGKTTTLYSVLHEINDPAIKIITVEDPIEYQLPGIVQVQVNAKIDLDFARVLRAMLRQDPDIALIGEMRDRETMEIGLRAAMTGHLVFSTLHTNDAVSTIMRLIDMGAEPYLLAASLRGILAQRLVRRVCDNCRAPARLDERHQILLRRLLGESASAEGFVHGSGCHFCNDTGYRGRIGIFELLELDAALVEALHNNELLTFGKLAVTRPGFRSLAHNALELARQGVTTMDEVLRISFGVGV
ncbi:MAG: GspE/PulE family protein [Gammaproteobacteria bacterium]